MVGRAPAFAADVSSEAPARGGQTSPRGLSLERLLELVPLTPEQGTAVGAEILHQLASDDSGARPSALTPRHVRVLPDGGIVIAARPGAEATEADSRETVRAAGRLACAALGVEAESDPEVSFSAAESVALPLVLLARAMALGALGGDVAVAERLFLERAGRFGSPERLQCSREELGALVTRLLQTAKARTQPAAPPTPAVSTRRRPSLLMAAASAVCLFVVGYGVVLAAGMISARHQRPSVRVSMASPPAAAAPTAAAPTPVATQPSPPPAPPLPLAVPVYAPAAAGSIQSVDGRLAGACAAGAACMLDVSVSFSPAPAPVAISWKLEIFDRCTGNQTEQAGQRFVAPAGWNHIVVTEPVQLPQQKAPVIVVVTTSPAAAASAPVSLSPPAC